MSAAIKEKTLVPELRFPEFERAWEEKKLQDICKMKSGVFVKASEINEVESNDSYPCFGANGLRGYTKTKTHTGTYPLIGRQGALCGNVRLAQGEFHATEHAIVVAVKNKGDHYWLFYALGNLHLEKYATGQAQPGLAVNTIEGLSIFVPQAEEQKKIASFLGAVDEKLGLLRRKRDLLTDYKRGAMQQLFSQKIRFTRNDGTPYPDWEEKKLGEIFTITRGQVLAMPKVTAEPAKSNCYPVYSSQTKNKGLAGYYSQFLFEDAITWTTDGANAGDTRFSSGKFYCTNVCGVLLSEEGYANVFMAELINSISKRYVSYVGNPKLMNNVMGSLKLTLPHPEEQQKIADFLTALDAKIDATTSQITALEAFKKGLLQKMFI